MENGVQAPATVPVSGLETWSFRIALILFPLLVMLLAVILVDKQTEIEGVVTFNRQIRGHDDDFRYEDRRLPPVGGIHHSQLQNCGIYAVPIETEKAVHSLEHGAVWITYEPGIAETDIAHLQEIVRGQQFILLSPFPTQRSPIVLTAWGVQLETKSVRDERIETFITRYRLGAKTPERGASCAGGFGVPLP